MIANSVCIKVVYQEEFDEGPFKFSGSINEVIDSLIAIRDSIPWEYRESAQCEISQGSYWDSYYANIEVSYRRPETPEETRARNDGNRAVLDQQLERERQTYERLRAKFERET